MLLPKAVGEASLDYRGAVSLLLGLADLERMAHQPGSRPRFDLGRMLRLLEALGNPHRAVPAVHITGTKGKGSVAAMVASALEAGGHRPLLYTSPHLHTFRERLRLGLRPLGEEEFASLVEGIWPAVEALGRRERGGVTTFEALTAMAFLGAVRLGCDCLVLEVGMGGRLDATNVVEGPLACAITSISLDHTHVLGPTVRHIAEDKAGIIKPGSPVVVAPQPPEALEVTKERARQVGAPLVEVARDYRWEVVALSPAGQAFRITGPGEVWEGWLPLLGEHQLENAACALALCRALGGRGLALSPEAVLRGLASLSWPGRMEVLSRRPLLVVDGAHNPYSLERLVGAVQAYLPHRRALVVFGVSQDKDLEGMVRALGPLRPLVFATRSRHPRARGPQEVALAFSGAGLPAQPLPTVAEAVAGALDRAGEGDLVLCTGSLFIAAEAREAVLGIEGEEYPELHPAHLRARV